MPSFVDAVYQRIFSIDPLLLLREHQQEFGGQILQNLLVERGFRSAPPASVDLHDPDSKDEFRRAENVPPNSLPETLREAYSDKYLSRTPYEQGELDELKSATMVSRGEYTNDRTGKVFADHDAAASEMGSTLSPLHRRFRIATIGYRVSISRMPGGGLLDEELCPLQPQPKLELSLTEFPEKKTTQKIRRTKLRSREKRTKWFDCIKEHFSSVLARGSHVVVAPEFGLPPNLEEAEVEEAISGIAGDFDHSYFLFSGTRHEGIHNRGFVVTRNATGLTDRWWHYKMASARGLGENITGPQNRRIPSYKFNLTSPSSNDTLDYRVFIPVCYDVFDPTTFINYVIGCMDAQNAWQQSIILVPSFNPAKEFVHALRDLSFIAGCPVVYVNGLHGDAKLFLYGVDVADLMEIDPNVPPSTFANPAGRTPVARSRIGVSIETGKNALRNHSRGVKDEFQSLQNAVFNEKLEQAVELRKNNLQEILTENKDRMDALVAFEDALNRLHGSGALRHLVTKEKCDHCTGSNHNGIPYCATDVLYYNLDPLLLEALDSFRQAYFKYDDFLPHPFRRANKLHIRGMIDAENDARKRRIRERMRA
jgi:hypothetical protein